MTRKPLLTACVALVLATAGCTGGNADGARGSPPTTGTPTTSTSPTTSPATPATAIWPAPRGPLALAVAAGLVPEVKESLAYHVHAHLDVFLDGKPVLV